MVTLSCIFLWQIAFCFRNGNIKSKYYSEDEIYLKASKIIFANVLVVMLYKSNVGCFIPSWTS